MAVAAQDIGSSSEVSLQWTRMCGVCPDKRMLLYLTSTSSKKVVGYRLYMEQRYLMKPRNSLRWLAYRFYNRHGIGNRRVLGKSASADVGAV